jgi:hypothetical protein
MTRFDIHNLIGYQLTWFACIGGAGAGMAWPGPVAVALFAAWHFRSSPSRQADLRLVAACIAVGLVLDTLWVQLGLLRFAAAWPSLELAPVWIMASWVAFALTLNHSFAALGRRPLLAATLGLVGAPLAYRAADRLWQAVELAPGYAAPLAIGIAWAVVLPALGWLAQMQRMPVAEAAR